VPVATVALNGAENAGILAAQMLAAHDPALYQKLLDFKKALKSKVEKSIEDLETNGWNAQ
jgi:5-(carboxyamino)imidazole ribonucleotide mutase